MYLWRIEKLKDELCRGPLDQRAAFAYVLATLLLYTLTAAVPTGEWNPDPDPATRLDWTAYALMVIVIGAGTYAAYRANGGQAGSDFTSRYFALGWVLFVRFIVLLIPGFLVLFLVSFVIAFNQPESNLSDTVIEWVTAVSVVGFEALYYWRLVHHFRKVAATSHARANQREPVPGNTLVDNPDVRRKNMDTSVQMLEELRRIRWLTTVIAISFMIVFVSMAWTSTGTSRYRSSGRYSRSFMNRASNLLDQGQAKEVLALVEEREKNSPMDGYVYWFRGRAYWQLGQYDAALKAMNRAEELCPNWRDEYTGPFINIIKEKLAKKS